MPLKNKFKVCKDYPNKSAKLTANVFKKQKSKIIEKPILTDKQLQNILKNIDNY